MCAGAQEALNRGSPLLEHGSGPVSHGWGNGWQAIYSASMPHCLSLGREAFSFWISVAWFSAIWATESDCRATSVSGSEQPGPPKRKQRDAILEEQLRRGQGGEALKVITKDEEKLMSTDCWKLINSPMSSTMLQLQIKGCILNHY